MTLEMNRLQIMEKHFLFPISIHGVNKIYKINMKHPTWRPWEKVSLQSYWNQ